MYQSERYPDFPWGIYRNQKECARVRTRAEADRVVRQLQKIYRNATLTVKYQGASRSHCGDGGKALD